MRKRILSIITVLALCLGLLPPAALAAETNTVYVGGVALAGSSGSIVYAITNESGEVITKDATADNYNIKWDGSTLTLCGATIKKELEDYGNPLFYIAGAAIGVFNQSGDANLTIQLEGDNTIEDVSYGICVLALSTGSANLTITGSGSLDVSATFTGIQIQSHSGYAAVSIENAKVTATAQWAYGVKVLCGTNSSASLTVNGGNLTSSGSPGILYETKESSIPSTIKFIVSNSALVDARGGGIGAGSLQNLKEVSPADDSVGIVFGHDRSDSKAGTVYGDVTLQENITIGKGESLTIPEGASLDTNGKTITVESGGKLEGEPTGSGTVKIAPTITTESLSGGTVGEPYTETILAATGDASITWSVSNGSLPAGLSLSEDGKITGTPTTEGTSTFTVTATNNIGSDSREFTLKIEKPAFIPVTDLELNKDSLTLQENGSDTLTATVEPADATNKDVTWASSDNNIATVSEDGTVTAINAGTATITATADGKSATCTVTVTAKPSPDRPVITKPSSSRISGADRFETAMETADQLKKELGVTEFSAIVVACSDDFADALSASAFAHENEAPVLIVNENNEERVKTYIEQNLTKDGTVYIMGGSAAVTGGFEDSLSDFDTVRFAGDDRYETNLKTLKELDLTGKQDIIIASGMDFADALSASSTGCPIMIVGERLTEPQIAFLKTLGGDDTYCIAGGTAAVSVEVEEQLRALNAGSVKRLAGEDRYETGVLIAETFYGRTGSVYIASGEDFPDGLTGGVLAGLTGDGKGAPLILVNRNNTERAAEYIDDVNPRSVKAIGGKTAVPDDVLKAVIR